MTTSQMRIAVKAGHIDEVIALHQEITSINYHKEKRKRFSLCVSNLSDEARWLLTFSCWFCLFNFRFKSIDESRYFSIPDRDDPEATFSDFLAVVRFFNRRKVTPSREGVLIRFLTRCTRAEKEFYLLLLSKGFTKGMPLMEIQTALDLGAINIQEIYGAPEVLQTGFSSLTYPVAITSIPSPELPLGVVSREPRSTFSLIGKGGELATSKPLVPVDLQYIKTPRFTVAGYTAPSPATGRNVFLPVDYFDTLKEFRRCRNDQKVTPYPERIAKLRRFQESNLLTQISTNYTGLAYREEEVLPEVVKVMENTPYGFVALTDARTVLAGQSHVVEVRVGKGIIDSFWQNAGRVEGFFVWFNGELFPVSFSFCGPNNSLLNSIAPLKGKLFEFLYMKVGSTRIGVGRKVLWDTLPWRQKRLRGSDLHVEKCAMCGGTSRHATRGICRVCEVNMGYYFTTYGPGAWVAPGPKMTRKRHMGVWEPSLLNAVEYSFKGHRLEAREDGCWRFAPNDTLEVTPAELSFTPDRHDSS